MGIEDKPIGNPFSVMKLSLVWVSLMVICITLLQPAEANPPTSDFDLYSTDIRLQYLRDESLTEDLHQVIHAKNWQDTKTRSFGFDAAAYWFRFSIPVSQDIQKVLEIRYPFLDDVIVYVCREEKVLRTFYVGHKYQFEKRPIQYRHFSFPLILSNKTATEVYIRVQNNGIIQVPLKLWDEKSFQQYQNIDNVWQGFFLGALAIVIFYSFVLFIFVRHIEYFYYCAFLICFLCVLLVNSGIGFQFIWPVHASFSNMFLIFMLMSATISACLLNTAYLQRKKSEDQLPPQLLRGLVMLSAMVIMLTFLLPYVVALSMAICVVLLTNLYLLYMGIRLLDTHETSIYYYTVSWAIFFLLIVYEISSKLGWVPLSSMDHYLLQCTGFVVACMLVFVLKRHLQSEQDMRLCAEQGLVQIKHQQAYLVEEGVKERTQVLEESIQNLSKANAELSRINQYDSLTNVYNRHCFNLRYKQCVQQAIEDKEILSMIIVDIDHFKLFNDNFGHHTGDQCLRKVAQTLQAEIHRSEDMLFRYGGEEFVVILPNTINRGSFTIAERMRLAIENVSFTVDGKQVPITISGGVASLYLHHEEDAHTLFNFADTALYEAKNAGRNQVNIFSL